MKSDEIGLPAARFDLFASCLQSKRHLFSSISWARVGFLQALGTYLQPDWGWIGLLTGRFDLFSSCIELANRSNRASCRLFAKKLHNPPAIGHPDWQSVQGLISSCICFESSLQNCGPPIRALPESPKSRRVPGAEVFENDNGWKKIMGEKKRHVEIFVKVLKKVWGKKSLVGKKMFEKEKCTTATKSTWKTSPFTHMRAWQALLVLWKQRLVTTVSKSTWKTLPFTHTRVFTSASRSKLSWNFLSKFCSQKKSCGKKCMKKIWSQKRFGKLCFQTFMEIFVKILPPKKVLRKKCDRGKKK